MTIRWGFLGAGYVASRAMAPAVHRATGARLQGVASRDEARSRDLEPITVYDSYTALVESPEIDAVYISLTNSQHCEWVVAALSAGKHVLCEKPLAMNANEVDVMQQAAVRHGVALVEAVWVRWHPRHRRFTDIVRSGNLGDDLELSSAFTFTSDMVGNYRLDPARGGGALMDVGCYQVHTWLASMGAGARVDIANVEQVIGPTGVDLTTRVQVDMHGVSSLGTTIGASGSMACSFIEEPRQFLSAQGSTARVEMVDGEAFTSWREPTSLRLADTIETFPDCDAFVLMVEQISRQFSGEEQSLFDISDSLRVARIIDAIVDRVQT